MSDPYIQELFAERIGGRDYGKSTAIYKFEKIKRAKKAAKAAKPDIDLIDMGVGEPDEMAYPVVVETLQEEAAKPENRGKEAAARYMKNVFKVDDIDPETDVLHSIGSKTALTMIPACFIDPGDYVLMTVPGYPVLGTHAKYYGGQVYNMPLKAENGFLPDLEAVPEDVLRKTKPTTRPEHPPRRHFSRRRSNSPSATPSSSFRMRPTPPSFLRARHSPSCKSRGGRTWPSSCIPCQKPLT